MARPYVNDERLRAILHIPADHPSSFQTDRALKGIDLGIVREYYLPKEVTNRRKVGLSESKTGNNKSTGSLEGMYSIARVARVELLGASKDQRSRWSLQQFRAYELLRVVNETGYPIFAEDIALKVKLIAANHLVSTVKERWVSS